MSRNWLFALLLGAPLSSACTQSSSRPPEPPDGFDRRALLSSLAQHVFLPAYGDIHEAVTALEAATGAHAAALGAGEAELLAARQAFATAMDRVEEAELYRVGPSGAEVTVTGGQTLRDELYSWPTVSSCRVDEVVAAGSYQAAGFFDGTLVNVYGLDALEYLLHAPDEGHRCGGKSQLETSGSWAALGAAEVRKRRGEYAHIVAQKLVSDAQALKEAWAPSGANFAATFSSAGAQGSPYPSAQEAVDQVFAGMYYLDLSTKTKKLAIPAGLSVECATDTCPQALELRWSSRSKEAVLENLEGFRALLTGTRTEGGEGVGFEDFLRARDAGALADDFLARMDSALATVKAVPGSLEQALAADPASVVAAHAAVKQVTDVLKSQFVTVLGLRVPLEGGGDND